MPDWDRPSNNCSTIGYLTMYTSVYDNELTDYIHKFDWENYAAELDMLKCHFEDMLEHDDGDITEECDLIGINSNSFQVEQGRKDGKHHLFLEWDADDYIPERHVLEQFDGMIIETGGGIHVMREDTLSMKDLGLLMNRWNCCGGYTSYSRQRGRACLRVSPKKGGNRLKILRDKDGYLYSVYKTLVETLDREI